MKQLCHKVHLKIIVDYKDLSAEIYEDLNRLQCSYNLVVENIPENKIKSTEKLIHSKLNKYSLTDKIEL